MQYPPRSLRVLVLTLALALAGGCGGTGPGDDGGPTEAGSDAGPGGGGSLPDGGDRDAGTGEGSDGGTSGLQPDPAYLPEPSGPCPTLADGTVTFEPAGLPARDVRIWMSHAAETLDGPLVFYWHGTGSSPSEASFGLGQAVIDQITSQGGIVAAPTADPDAGTFPWFLTTAFTGGREDDLRVADEILGCALEQVGVDVRHIHSIGMSAGGLQTTQMSYRRSGYVASVVTWSGGLIGSPPPSQDPDNGFGALIFHGGTADVVVISFQDTSERYWQDLTDQGRFAAICDHGGGHTIPTDARESAWRFFQDHPFGAQPSPYLDGLPEGFPAYCGLTP